MSFHNIAELGLTEERQAKTRAFTGDGSPVLPVPGLQSLSGVRIGPIEIPLVLPQKFPVNAAKPEVDQITLPVPMVLLEHLPDGSPVLLRNKQSNDGLWQKGAPILVTGEWDEPVEETEARRSPGRARRELAGV